jgi:ribosomal-protein-alanine N-acetyltransferase
MGGRQRSTARNRVSQRVIMVRVARDSDIDSVLSIEQASFVDPWARGSFETALELDRMLFLVAEGSPAEEGGRKSSGGGEVLGFVIALLLFDEAEVADLAVVAAARGQGIGGQLLDQVAADVYAVGVRSLYLEVRESNVSARALYDSRSFAQVGRRRGYYRSPIEDALLMRRDL